MISYIVLGSLRFIDPKEKSTNECIEACQTLEDNLSCGAYLSNGIKVCLYRKQQICVFIKHFPTLALEKLLMIAYSKKYALPVSTVL